MNRLRIEPAKQVDFDLAIPGTKSMTNRALICAALAEGSSSLSGASFCEDSLLLVEALRAAGIEIETHLEKKSMTVRGCAGAIPAREGRFTMGNAGTSLRFFTGFLIEGGYQILQGRKSLPKRLPQINRIAQEFHVPARGEVN